MHGAHLPQRGVGGTRGHPRLREPLAAILASCAGEPGRLASALRLQEAGTTSAPAPSAVTDVMVGGWDWGWLAHAAWDGCEGAEGAVEQFAT